MAGQTTDLKLSDRELLRMVLAAQKETAKILFLMNINGPSRVAAGELYQDLEEALKGIPK